MPSVKATTTRAMRNGGQCREADLPGAFVFGLPRLGDVDVGRQFHARDARLDVIDGIAQRALGRSR